MMRLTTCSNASTLGQCGGAPALPACRPRVRAFCSRPNSGISHQAQGAHNLLTPAAPAGTARVCKATSSGLSFGNCSRQRTQQQAPARGASGSARSSVVVSSAAAVPAGEPAKVNPFINVVLPTGLALLLCNMDRICLSVAILPMSVEFGWPASLQGIIQSAFLWGYMATQLVGGTLADRYGGKRVLAGGMAWFSLASLLLPCVLSPSLTPAIMAAGLTVPVVLVSRFLVGLGEGVALPAMSNLVASHIPPAAKARALGMCFSGFHSGNLAGLILSPLLLLSCGWRGLFLIFGALGLPMLLFWTKAVPDAPAAPTAAAASTNPSGPSQSQAAASQGGDQKLGAPAAGTTAAPATAEGVPGADAAASAAAKPSIGAAQLLTSPATWAIIIVNVVNHFGYFIYLNWMPTYFNKALGLDLRASSFTAFLPWLVMAVGSSLAGLLADTLVARGMAVTTVRKSLQTVAFLVPAAALLLLSQPGITPQLAIACMTVALGTTSLGQAGFVANMSDVAPRHAGKMFGLCNTFGCLSGIVGVTAVGFIVDATRSFTPVFQLTAALYVVGTLVWNLMCTGERVFD